MPELHELQGKESIQTDMAPSYPEHEKIDSDKLQIIAEFHEWLENNGYAVAKINVTYYEGSITRPTFQNLRDGFFGTTEAALEKERLEMLANHRNSLKL